jgi:osmotically-inducible protein OsmY
MSGGTTDKAKGRVNEAVGALIEKLRRQGKTDQAVSKAKNTVEEVIYKAKKIGCEAATHESRRGAFLAAALLLVTIPSFGRAGDRATSPAEAQVPADNTGRNARDSDGNTMTADKQSNSPDDLEITRKIRAAITDDKSLSASARNVKIVTVDRVVTLRGPVVSAEEKASIAEKAKKVAGVSKIDNQLEIAKP